MQNYIRRLAFPLLGFGGTLFGGSFNTLIGIIFWRSSSSHPMG